MAGFIGKGDLYIDRDRQGKYLLVGNATQFEIDETEVEVKERISRMRDTYGQALDRVTLQRPAKCRITIDEFDPENLALALRGLLEQINVASGNVTEEEISAALDAWVPLAHDKIESGSVVVTDSSGSTTYTEGEDYEVNYRLGMIKALSSGSITDGETLKVDYSYAAKQGWRIKGSRVAEIDCAMILDGQNRADGRDCKVTVYWAKLAANQAVDFLTEDWGQLVLEGTLVTPPDRTEPYTVEYLE